MDKKTWSERVKGLEKLLKVAEFHEKKAVDDQEELSLMIATIKDKIKTFK